MRLLPSACASAIERAHDALPDALHRAAFHLGSLAHEREPFPRLVFDLTLTVGTLVKLLLWRLCFLSVDARAWLAAASLSVAHDAVDVARVIFHESAYRFDLPWTREAFSRRQRFYRLCFSVSRLALLLRLALDEATAMIATVDHFALGLGAGDAGTYTVGEHALGFLQTTLWTSLLLSRSNASPTSPPSDPVPPPPSRRARTGTSSASTRTATRRPSSSRTLPRPPPSPRDASKPYP